MQEKSPPSISKGLPPLTDLLDVREEREGVFVEKAAWIPLGQLRSRLSELPAASETFKIANLDQSARLALDFLVSGGRAATVTDEIRMTATSEPFRLWRPNSFLEEMVPSLPPSVALDLGCGAGRETALLLASGWDVRAIDNLPDAVERTRSLARSLKLDGRLLGITADIGDLPDSDLKQAGLICALFCFDRDAIQAILDRCLSGRRILIEAFTETHARKFGKPKPGRYVLDGELAHFHPGLNVLVHDQGWRDNGRHTVRFLGEKL